MLKDETILRRQWRPLTRLPAACSDVHPFGDGQVGSEPRHITLESMQRQLDMVIDSHFHSGASLRREIDRLRDALHDEQASSRARSSSADQRREAEIMDLHRKIEALGTKSHECYEEVVSEEATSDE